LIVVDASVLANVVGDDGDDGAAARGRMRSEAALAAPDLIDIETLAVLRKRWLAGSLTETRFQDAINDLRALALDRYPALPLIGRIAELRANVTAYDAAYVALAEALGCRYSPPTSASPTPPARSAPSWSSCRSSGKTHRHRRFVTSGHKRESPPQRCFRESERRGSNPRPSAWEADALPTELRSRCTALTCKSHLALLGHVGDFILRPVRFSRAAAQQRQTTLSRPPRRPRHRAPARRSGSEGLRDVVEQPS
jgi:predicted nucleic acid-binding protein